MEELDLFDNWFLDCPILKAVQPDGEAVLEAKDLASHVDGIVLKD